MKSKWTEIKEEALAYMLIAGVAILLFLALGGSWVVRSYFEARAYERVTGKSVSTWDAMFLELRVTNAPPSPEAGAE